MSELREYFFDPKNKATNFCKYDHYFEIYDRYLSKFKEKKPKYLEIGIARGGALLMFDHYFKERCQIFGIDLNTDQCPKQIHNHPRIQLFQGDQADRDFLKKFKQITPKMDIIVDDGGHQTHQQWNSLEELFDHLNPGGVYICEDICFSSYWEDYGQRKTTFIEKVKDLIDSLNAWHIEFPWGRDKREIPLETSDVHVKGANHWTHSIDCIHFHDNLVVIEKALVPHLKPPIVAFIPPGGPRPDVDTGNLIPGSWTEAVYKHYDTRTSL